MKQILLVGNMNGALDMIHKELVEFYQVQICAANYKSIAGMIKIVKPDMVVLFQHTEGDFTKDIMLGLRGEWPDVPVMIICKKEEKSYFTPCIREGQFEFAFRPIKKADLKEQIENFFIVHLEEMQNKEGDEEEEPKKTGPAPGVKYKILAVDDNPVIIRTIKELLGDDYNVYGASSGQKALDIAEKVDMDLILLDYEMPGMSGVDTLKKFKKHVKTYKVPVVFLTAVAERDKIKEVITYQPAGYLLKPIDVNMLKKTISDVLG